MEIVNDVVRRRAELLAVYHGMPSDGELSSGHGGRLLSYVPSENVADGTSRYASKGFFDPDDAPPWDTWLHYSDGTLVSWVPDVLLPLAQAGIDANCVACIGWVDTI